MLAPFLALAGWWFRSTYLRWFASVLFVLPLGLLGHYALHTDGRLTAFGREWNHWTPAAVLLLILFYANRLSLDGGRPYSFAASLLLAALIGAEVPADARALAYTLATILLWFAGRRTAAGELRLQAAVQCVLSLLTLFAVNPTVAPLLTLGLPAAIYLTDGLPVEKPEAYRRALCCAGNLFLGFLIDRLRPAPHRALACGLAALALRHYELRRNSLGALASTAVLGFAAVASWREMPPGGWARLAGLLPFIALLYAPPRSANRPTAELRILHGTAGVFLLCLHLPDVAAKGTLTLAYAATAAALLVAGFLLRDRFRRLAALSILLFCFGKLFFYDFRQLDTTSCILSFIGLGLLLIGASWAYSRFKEQIRRYLFSPRAGAPSGRLRQPGPAQAQRQPQALLDPQQAHPHGHRTDAEARGDLAARPTFQVVLLQQLPVAGRAVGQNLADGTRVIVGLHDGGALAQLFGGAFAPVIDAHQILSNRIHPHAHRPLALQLRTALPTTGPGGLGDLLGQVAPHAGGQQKTHRPRISPLESLFILLLGQNLDRLFHSLCGNHALGHCTFRTKPVSTGFGGLHGMTPAQTA